MKTVSARPGLSLRITLLTATLITLVVAALTAYSYSRLYRQVEEKFGWTLEHIAKTAALEISGEDHERVRRAGDEDSPEFGRIRDYLQGVMRENDLTPETIYTFHASPSGNLTFGVMLHEKPFVGDYYPVPEKNMALVKQALGGQSSFTRLYTDEHGSWISGFAPIRNADGRVNGLLAVDYRVDRFIAALEQEVLMNLGVGLLFVLLGVVVSYRLARQISRPIERLNSAAQGIMNEDYDVSLEVKGRDEVSQLTRSFNSMAASLRERLMMLRYVPRHTKEMIRKTIENEITPGGERKEVAILFSDVRGFTKYSQSHFPEDVIKTLNVLLGLQGEIIEKHSGYVDKFVGDEVVAIFEGPPHERVRNAMRAAVEIQKSIEERCQRAIAAQSTGEEAGADEALRVGIGISMGDVVMGSMGSSSRQDYTVIGDNVNLAARLCNGAGGGEILLSSNVYRISEGDPELAAEIPIRLKGLAKIKGFMQKMHVYVVRPADDLART
ncbi:MAG: adenylate/guanylate cyclase domain-containing protein [bacterium]|nr:adenylate/guanylate cyclase domain-containing protein [bacterium]